MATIGLISCVKRKGRQPAPAEFLYTSDWFRKARAYVLSTCDRWFILSAKYGLLQPQDVIDPYEQTLKNMSKPERQAWAAKVWEQLRPFLHPGDQIIVLAGYRYREFLLPVLQKEHRVHLPLAHISGLGNQQRWLQEHTS